MNFFIMKLRVLLKRFIGTKTIMYITVYTLDVKLPCYFRKELIFDSQVYNSYKERNVRAL